MSKEVNKDERLKVLKSVIANQIALNYNEDLKHSFPRLFSHKIKQSHNNYIEQLRKSEKNFDILFNGFEENCTAEYDIIDLVCKALSSIPSAELVDLIKVIQAFIIDRENITEIAIKTIENHIGRQTLF